MEESKAHLSDEELYIRICAIRDGLKDALNIDPTIINKVLQSEIGIETRRRAKEDLYFLAKYFLRKEEVDLMTELCHRVVCDLFVKKDSSKSFADQDKRKARLLLYPRGSFKSTIDCADAIQWILNFPNIRILFLTSVDDNAVGFLSETRDHFVIKEKSPSLMNVFFPEFCVPFGEKGNAFEFTTPQRTVDHKEPTLLASSIGSNTAGLHWKSVV